MCTTCAKHNPGGKKKAAVIPSSSDTKNMSLVVRYSPPKGGRSDTGTSYRLTMCSIATRFKSQSTCTA